MDLRLYTVIYDVLGDIKSALEGLVEPTYREEIQGHAQVRETFNARGVGTVAGCYITDGNFQRSNPVRLVRDQIVVYEGELGSLRRFKDDVREVATGFECGMAIQGYQDIKVGDIIEAYKKIAGARHIDVSPGRQNSQASVVEDR